MKYTIYKITNLINDKIYIGCHKTNNLDDDYMGSGVHLKRAQNKYGLENFTKEILEVHDNPEDMFEAESILVNEEFVLRKDTYNLKQGGYGGFDYINSTSKNNNGDKFQWYIERLKDEEFRKLDAQVKSERFKRLHKEGKIKYDTFTGMSHSDEAKRKIGEANSKHQSGEGNSQYGKIWIHNFELKESKSIKREDYSFWKQDGWLKGRKMKF